jgi:hypothetical protein
MARQHGSLYSRSRLVVVICVMTANALLSLVNTIQHRYPIGIAAVFFLDSSSTKRTGSKEWPVAKENGLFSVVLPVGRHYSYNVIQQRISR